MAINFKKKTIFFITLTILVIASIIILAIHSNPFQKKFHLDCSKYNKDITKQECEKINNSITIPPQFDEIRDFNEGLASTLKHKSWGYIDKRGIFIIKPQYNQANDFKEGFAGVKINNKWGIINKKGKYLVEPEYDMIDNFNDGYAYVVKLKDSKQLFGLINKKGIVVLPIKYDHIGRFSEGLIAVSINHKNYFINKKLQPVLNIKDSYHFDSNCSNFKEGLACFQNEKDKYGYINKEGKVIVEPAYDKTSGFHEGIAYVYIYKGIIIRKSIWGDFYADNTGSICKVINNNGKLLQDKSCYPLNYSFYDGLQIEGHQYNDKKENYKFGYIDKKGKFVIKPIYDEAYDFSEGLAVVKIKNRSGFINKKGKFVIKPLFSKANPPKENLASIEINHKWGVIDILKLKQQK